MMDVQIGTSSPPSAGDGGEVRAGVIEDAVDDSVDIAGWVPP